ncbi:MFS transporter [Photobacterium sp. BZF1]|uniref:MFS transporter n=1 Tax=Photobacterium sp. BZF1 TaxID=1904457 RepID=UPI001653419A|nr:MFS transporter [Photobacterium sp. BZF1]MBC7001059.1 MFS transporter [Photobacterium sp. BZF1]
MIRFLICSFALVLLYPTAIDLYLVGLPQIAHDLGATESQLHIAFSIYLAGMATTMLFAGRLSDTIGRKPIAIAGAIIFIFASLLGGQAENSTVFLVARFAQGIGAGSCYVVAFAILRDTLDDQRRAKVLSMLNGIICIVPVIAPVIGHLIMLKFPWPSLFSTMAGMGVLVCLLSVLVLKESNTNRLGRSNHTTLVPDPFAPGETQHSQFTNERFLDRFFVSRVVITSIGVTTILTYVNVSPMLVMDAMGFDRGGYSTTMALTALVSMLASFSAPFLLSIFKQRSLMLFSQGLFAAAAIVLMASGLSLLDQVANLIGFSLICAGFSIGFGVTMSQALSPYSQRAGVASSILGIAQVCASAFYIWLMGLMGVSALNMLITVLALGGVISAALILLIPLPALPTCCKANEEITRAS